MTGSQTHGAEILLKAYDLITGDRHNAYAHPSEDYGRTAAIFKAVTGHDLSVEEAIMFMICVKMSRLVNEMNTKQWLPDNATDAAGYLGCLQMVRENRYVIPE
jgi:hypothetical protein